MKMVSKNGFRTAFVLLCLCTGFIVALSNQQAFTAQSLIETLLICLSVAYICIKYFTSSLITRYQQEGYRPAPARRRAHMLLTAISTEAVLPLCIDFLCACAVLMAFKLTAPEYLPRLARWVYDLYAFSEGYLKRSLSWLLIILAGITLLRIMSHRALKRYRQYIKWVSVPVSIASLMAFFVHADSGITSNVVSWQIQSAVPVYDKKALTFNAGAGEEAEMKAIVATYAEFCIRELSDGAQDAGPDSLGTAGALEHALVLLEQYEQKDPAIKTDIFDGKAGASRQPDPAYREGMEKLYERLQKSGAGFDEFKPTAVFETVYRQTGPASRKSLLAMLLDENERIPQRQLNANESLLADILKEFLGETWFFKDAPANIRFYAFAKDASFDLLKDRCAKGLMFLLDRMKGAALNKFDLRVLRQYLVRTSKTAYRSAAAHLQQARLAIGEFGGWYRNSIQRKAVLEAALQQSLTRENVAALLREFPNAANGKYYMECAILLDAFHTRDPAILLEADMAYWRKVSTGGKGLDEELVYALERQQAFQQAEQAGTREAAVDFARRYPDDPVALEIRNMEWFGETEALSRARSRNTIDGWNEFLEHYPDSEHRVLIETAVREAKLEQISLATKSVKLHIPSAAAAEEGFFRKAVKYLKKAKFR